MVGRIILTQTLIYIILPQQSSRSHLQKLNVPSKHLQGWSNLPGYFNESMEPRIRCLGRLNFNQIIALRSKPIVSGEQSSSPDVSIKQRGIREKSQVNSGKKHSGMIENKHCKTIISTCHIKQVSSFDKKTLAYFKSQRNSQNLKLNLNLKTHYNQKLKMTSKKTLTKKNDGLFNEQGFVNLFSNEKFNRLISKVIEDKFEEQLEERVRAYCQRYIKIENGKGENKGVLKNDQFFAERHRKEQKFYPRKVDANTTQKSCRKCGKTQKIDLSTSKKEKCVFVVQESKLAGVKSDQIKNTQNKISVLPQASGNPNKIKIFNRDSYQRDQTEKRTSVLIMKNRSKSTKSNFIVVNKSPSNSQSLNIQLSLMERLNQSSLKNKKKSKMKRVLRYLEGEERENIQKVEKLVNKHLHMRSKEIAHLIKQNHAKSQAKAKSYKGKSYNNIQQNPYVNNENDEFYRLNKTTIYSHMFDEYQNMSLDEVFPSKKNGKIKSMKEKDKIFKKMLDLFSSANRTQLNKFIEVNEKLCEKELIEKWIIQKNEDDFEYLK